MIRGLREQVVEALWAADELVAKGIQVVVIGHDVWLEGDVPTPAMYDLAEHLAAQVGGVRDLTNNLRCIDEPYDLSAHRDGMDLRVDPSTDVTADGRLEVRIDPFGEEWDGATPLEGEGSGGPVGGESGQPIHPMEFNELAPLATEILQAEEPWRYQEAGPNANLDPAPVLPPDEDEV
jgi:hypothetical protein